MKLEKDQLEIRGSRQQVKLSSYPVSRIRTRASPIEVIALAEGVQPRTLQWL